LPVPFARRAKSKSKRQVAKVYKPLTPTCV
jgi:hypothetical protein